MARPQWNATPAAFDPASAADPQAALARLPGLTRELARDYSQTLFLTRIPLACVVLMIAGAAALLLTGPNIKPGFGWAVMLLMGIIAMVRTYIRGAARTLRRVPLEDAASDLRLLLLYGGVAWGGGAWLLMPDAPSPALVFTFAVAAPLSLVLILKDAKGALAFTAPVVISTTAAAILGAWPLSLGVSSAILAAGIGIILLPALQHADKIRMTGLTLR